MTPLEWGTVVDWIIDRWGVSAAWKRPAAIYDDFAQFTKGAAMEAAWNLYREGLRYSPGPSVMYATTARVQQTRYESGVDQIRMVPCDRHRWAIVDHDWGGEVVPYAADGPGVRHVVCAACGEERTGQYRAKAEL